jgi:ribosomal protein RSM22 (predicted rRNA methylase)
MADAEAVAEGKHDACDADLRELAGALTQAGADVAKFTGLTVFDAQTCDTRKEELANKVREIGDRKAMLETLGAQREKEAAAYANLKAEYASVFAVLDDCRAIIQSRLVAGDSFLQTNTGIQTALVARLKKFQTPAKGVAHGYGAFFKLLAQVVEKSMEVHADQAVVQRLFDIMDRIEENMEMAEAVERDAERTRQADYDELVEKVEAQLMYTQRQVVDLQGSISTLEDRIAASSARIANAMEAAANLQVRLEDRGAECEQD